jgi:hypothetical protein
MTQDPINLSTLYLILFASKEGVHFLGNADDEQFDWRNKALLIH